MLEDALNSAQERFDRKPLLKRYVDKEFSSDTLVGYLKAGGSGEFIDWLSNLQNALIVGTFNLPNLTTEQLQFRKGEVSALGNLIAKINDIRNAKPVVEETEEENG